MSADGHPEQPSLPWRMASSFTMGFIGIICRVAMKAGNHSEMHGLDEFLELLDKREDPKKRERGLITVSNHISVLDDPFIWGALPFSYHFNPTNHRWSLGSYDLCFTNKALSTFFTLGQVLPTQRHAHSEHGGLFQPTITQAIRLLSRPPFTQTNLHSPPADPSLSSPDLRDPFTDGQLTYTTTGLDTFPAPSAYPSRQYSWLHVFPEGRVHQHPQKTMRYFKWGVARLILEPDVCPDIIPMWIEGCDQIMHESREFPRFIPRLGKQVGIWFGENVGGDKEGVFGELRRKWRQLVEEDRGKRKALEGVELDQGLGILSEDLKYGPEAQELRMECTRRVRKAVLGVRRLRGLPDEDPKEGLVETWAVEGGKKEGRMEDGSWVKDM
ncbi:MAG: hypothetical protein MMC33_004438 [Icmadophila ericetorum]|nr:hypothetical protein [Icmadophila ericetorum]